MLGLGPIAQDLVSGWAMQDKGRALWCIGDATYKVQTLLHPLEKRSEEHTSELQSLMRISYAVFCLKKKTTIMIKQNTEHREQSTNQKNSKQKRQYNTQN